MTTASDLLALAPTAAYLFDETSGTTLVDATANGRDGTYSATGVTLGQPGLTADSPAAASFDGTSGAATVSGVDTWLATGAVSAAITATAVDATGGSPIFIFVDSLLYLWLSDGGFPAFGVLTSAGYEGVSGPTAVTSGSTVRIAGTCDGTTLRLYHEGEAVASLTLSGTLAAPGASAHFASDGGGFYACTLDEAGLFDSALSDAQVRAMHPPPPVGTDQSSVGYGYDGYGEVGDNLTPAPIPAGVNLAPIRRVHLSLPAPTLVDGRPT